MMIDELISFLLMIPIINDTYLCYVILVNHQLILKRNALTDIEIIRIECLKAVLSVMRFKSAYNIRDTFNFIVVD